MGGTKSLLGGVKKSRGKKAAAATGEASEGNGVTPGSATAAGGATGTTAAAPGKRPFVPAGRVTGSDEACTVTLSDMLSVLERDKMYCKSELLYRWLNKAARTTAG